MTRQATQGAAAEDNAAREAARRGYRLVTRNYRTRLGELDLVLAKNNDLIITEVRMRGNPRFGGAAASVDYRKQRRIVAATRMFLAAHPRWQTANIRFDVVAFDNDGSMNWIENAFPAE